MKESVLFIVHVGVTDTRIRWSVIIKMPSLVDDIGGDFVKDIST